MATTFIAKHGLKSNINKLKLSEGEIAIAYSEDKTKAEIYSGSKDGTPILLIQEINVSELLANANEYTNTKISELVDGAPEAMDTLKELADAIAQNSDIMSALQSAIGNKANEAELSGHISDTNNPHTVTKEQLGLENVDNTSDIDKPISTAIQEALNDKAPTNHASSATTYGMGNASNYGHLKLSDSTTSTSSTGSGIAATPKAVKTISDTLSTEISDRQAADNELKAKFTDLKTVAFTGSYTDLSNKPTSMQNPNSLTLTMNGSATSYNGSATASKSWYAPTSGGTAGYNLISNGSGAPVWQQPPYAVCGDSPSISDRRVSITNFKLVTGVRVLVRFTYPFAGTQGKVTLNVNSTGAKEVKLLRADGSYDAITQYNSWSTNEIVEFVYDGTYWVALSSDKQFVSGKPSVITVGSSTVTRYCDFKCSGTDDDIVIQKAMDSLTDGGKIILLEGTYNLSSRLLQKKNVVIEGQGRGITKVNTSYIFLISNLVGTSPTLHLTNMDINFLSTSNISPNAGAFNDYDVLQIDNCSISYANTLHNTDSLFKNCNVKLSNSKITVTLPAKRFDSSHVCWWVFRECTVELTNTGILFPSGSNNTLSNGVFYACNGTIFGGFIQHIGTTISSTHSYVESFSAISFVGTQIECRRFSQSETTTGDFNTLSNCRIKILQASGYFNASHISHCDFYISGAIIFCAYCMASNSKLWFSAASLATLKNYCFFEACYTNQSTWIGTNGTGTSTTDTKTVSGMAAPSFRSVS